MTRSLSFILLLALACGESGPSEGPNTYNVELADLDASVPTPPDPVTLDEIEVEAPTAPAAPTPVDPGTCPAGFAMASRADAPVCDPFPEGAAGPCAEDELLLPGMGCTPLGECLADFPPAAPNTLYVQAGARDGNGTRARPFGVYMDAFSAASPGDTILVGPGVYEGPNLVKGGTTVRGLCRATTIFRSTTRPLDPAPGATLATYLDAFALVMGDYGPIDGDVVLENVTVQAPGHVGVLLLNGQGAFRDVHFDGAEGFAIFSTIEPDPTGPETGEYAVENVLIRNVEPFQTTSLGDLFFTIPGQSTRYKGGVGIYANYTDISVNDTEIRDVHAAAIYAGVDSAIAVRRTAVRGVQQGESSWAGGDCFSGVRARGMEVIESYCREYAGRGITAATTDVVVERVWFEDSALDPIDPDDLDLFLGQGIQAYAGGTVQGRWVTGVNLRALGVSATTPPGGTRTGGGEYSFDLEDVVLDGVREASYLGGSLMAVGLWVTGGANGRVRRASVRDVRGTGAYAVGRDALLELEDFSLARVSPTGLVRAGYGVTAEMSASVSVTRAEVNDTARVSLLANTDGHLQLRDVSARDDGSYALIKSGLHAAGGGSIDADRVALATEGAFGIVFVDGDGVSRLRDVLVSPAPSRGERAEAFAITHEAEVTLERVRLEQITNVGLVVQRPAAASVSELEVMAQVCVGDCELENGYGISAIDDPTLTIDGFRVSGSGCGVHVAALENMGTAGLSIARGTIEGNSIGICAEVQPDFLLALPDNQVYVRDNLIPLSTTSLPPPEIPEIPIETDDVGGYSEGGQSSTGG